MKFFKSVIKIICDLWKWLETPGRISSIVLIITLIFAIITFQYAYRPYVGVSKCTWSYNKSTKDMVAMIAVKNLGNIPANNVRTNIQMFVDSISTYNLEAQSRFLLFQEQETFGPQIFHNIEESKLNNYTMDIHVKITYELPIKLIIHWWTRKFETTQVLRYDHKRGGCRVISGEST